MATPSSLYYGSTPVVARGYPMDDSDDDDYDYDEEYLIAKDDLDDGRKKRSRIVGVAVAAGLVAVLTLVVAVMSRHYPKRKPPEMMGGDLKMKLSNEYERRSGRAIGDGMYPYEYLAEVYQSTRFSVQGDDCEWTFDDEVLEGCVVEKTLTRVGEHSVKVRVGQERQEGTVTAKYVRHELRDLTPEDRERYLEATAVLYRTPQDDGEKLYGPSYKSAAWLVREHLFGAASKECDHWHDDAGFLNHHVGITWQFEQSIQSVDPRVSASYWDYTIDAEAGIEFGESILFSEDWFGASSPKNKDHVVNQGRFAYVPILKARDAGVPVAQQDQITNPFGLLRSPWNTNSEPYLLRYSSVLDVQFDGYELTKCSDFADSLSADVVTMASLVSKLNGRLHGPIHIMIGGHWGFAANASRWLGDGAGARSRALLASKFLWRQGYVRCPEACTSDETCQCSCPSSLVGTTSDDAYKVLKRTGLLDINKSWKPENYDVSWKDVLTFLCHIGHPGEMFTSAAPQDPTFWPLHGNAERFVHLVRLLSHQSKIILDDTWGYDHVKAGLDSDTNVVCDWSNVSSTHDLPTCDVDATCPGHREDDLLPFLDLLPDQSSFLTNREFFTLSSPLNPQLPYVYDRTSYWPACPKTSVWGPPP